MRRPLCVFCAGTLGLELVCAFLPQTGRFVPFAAFFAVGLLWALAGRLRKSPAWGYGICLILGAVLGLVLTGSTQAKWEKLQTAYDGRSVLLEAEVERTSSSYFPGRVRAVLRVETVDREAASLRVECASLPTCSPGDRVKGRFALEMPDATARLNALADGIALNAAYEKGFAQLGQSTSFRARTARLQKRLSAALRQGMASGPAGVLAAMVAGDRTHLSKELRTAYRGAGLSHVLVVSGMHVSILCGDVLGRLLPNRKKRLRGYTGRRVRALFSAVLALLLVGVTGFTPSVLRAAGAVWLSALGVWVYGPPDALTSLGVAGVLMTSGNSYAVCDVGFQLSFGAVVGPLAGGAVVRRSQEAWEKQRAKKKRPRLRFWKRKALGLAGSLWETVCISAGASMATFPVLVLRGMSTSLYALVSGAAVLWLVEPILLTGLGAALLGLVPALAPAQRVFSCCAEFLAEVLDRWALWVSGWPGAQIWFDTAYAAVVCLLLAGLCWLAFHNRVRLRVALPALLLTAGLAVFTGNALNRDVVRVELVGSRNAPAVVISRNGSAVILFRGGDVTRSAVETTLERRNIRTVECLIDLRLRPRSAQRMGAEQRIAVDRMALYATRRVRCGPAEVEVLRTRNGCVARIHAAGQTFVTLSGSAALAAPVQADYLLASPARPDCVKYDAILSLSSDYRWMPAVLPSGAALPQFFKGRVGFERKNWLFVRSCYIIGDIKVKSGKESRNLWAS